MQQLPTDKNIDTKVLAQIFILPYKNIFFNKNCEIYEYQHYNPISLDDKNCPFCNLASKVELISETDTTVAFLDNFPVNQGHTLIIPKRHISN